MDVPSLLKQKKTASMQYTRLADSCSCVNERNAVKDSRAKCSTFTIEHINPVIENIDSTGTLDADWVK
jgi:hypothetical protein